MGIFVSLRR